MVACALVMGATVLVACGGGDDDEGDDADVEASADDASDEGTDATTADDGDAAATTAAGTDTTLSEVNILTDFGDVCRGVALPGATAYDPATPGVHPIVAVAGEDPEYESASSDLPDTWDPVVGQEQTVELVVCMARTAATLNQTCDGYQDDDGNDTGNTVEVYDASYDVTVIAATTGEVVAETQLDATDDDCPMFMFFDEGETVAQEYAEPTDALVAFLADHVET